MKKKILFLTGTRADFGKIKSLILNIQDSDKFESNVFVTGMHLIKRYGYTLNELKKANIKNIFTFINQRKNDSTSMDVILANTIIGLSGFVEENKPDLIVVHGDRVETLAGAIVGSLNNILVAHIEGGELSGTVDELIRHAVSKLSHAHFVSNNKAKKRLLKMGEQDSSVFVIGSPEVDIMLSNTLPNIFKVKKRYGIHFNNFDIFCYHSVTTDVSNLKKNIHEVVSALIQSKRKMVVIFPNNDFGTEIILNEFNRIKNNKNFILLPSMRFEYYLTLLKNSRSIIGNSSSGVREAPVYGIQTINIGNRQNNRHKSESIFDILENKKGILNALLKIKKYSPVKEFGLGNSHTLFLKILEESSFWKIGTQKQFKD